MGLRKLTGQKTYWHLLDAKRRPSVYEIVSSRLHYYPSLGFSVVTPTRDWYRQYQSESAFRDIDWEAFSDPRKTTYTRYTQLQNERETYISGLLDSATETEDAALPADWLDMLAQVFAPLRYPCHGLMMLAAYLSSMAAGSRVTIAAAFQAADEIRRVNGLARRLHQLRRVYPELGQDAKTLWLEHDSWQGLRKVIEQTLVIYDWSKCFIALNLALKPSFDHLFLHSLASCARSHGDTVTAQLLGSLAQDAYWHGEWSRELLTIVLEQAPQCRATVADCLDAYTPGLDQAIAMIAPSETVAQTAATARADYLTSCGLESPG